MLLHNPSLNQAPTQPFLHNPALQQCLEAFQGSHPTNLLITGEWGAGKSVFLNHLADHLEKSVDHTPVSFPQDNPGVLHLGHFFSQALKQLLNPAEPSVKRVLDEKFPGAQRGKALDLLQNHARSQGTNLVLLVDNFDALLMEQWTSQDISILGQILTHEPWLSVVGSASACNLAHLSGSLTSIWQQIALSPLDEERAASLWEANAKGAPSPVARAFCLYICGGNPRLIASLAQTHGASMDMPASQMMSGLLDFFTPYYIGRVRNLPAVERKVFAALADYWAPVTARAIAQASAMDVSKASSLLNRLVKRGLVQVNKTRGRTKWYEVHGPLLTLNYLARTQTGPCSRLEGLCGFMDAWFFPGKDAEQPQKDPGQSSPPPLPAVKEKPVPRPPIPVSPPESASQPMEPDSPQDAASWTELAKTLEAEGLFQDASLAYKKSLAIKPDHAWAWGRLAEILRKELESYPESEDSYLKAIELDPNQSWIWCGLGQLLHENLKNYVEAEQAYRIGIELDPIVMRPRLLMGRLHERLDKHQSAIKTYEEAARIDEENPQPVFAMGELLESQHKVNQAHQAYVHATNCRPSHPEGWVVVGLVWRTKLSEPDQAKKAYERALDLDPNHYPAWEGLMLLEGLSPTRPGELSSLAASYLDAQLHSPKANQNLERTFSKPEVSHLYPAVEPLLTPKPLPHTATSNMPSENTVVHETPPPPVVEPGLAPLPVASTLEEALDILATQTLPRTEDLHRAIHLAIKETVGGHGSKVLTMLSQFQHLDYLMPLWVGISEHMGMDIEASPEVLALASRVKQRIRDLGQ